MKYTGKYGTGISNPWTAISVATAVALWCMPAVAQRTAATPCQAHATAVEATDFGAKGDSGSDNVQPFKDALAYAAKCSVPIMHVAAGTYRFTPHGPSAGILLPSNLSLIGDGADKTVIQVAAGVPGANFDSLFWARNQDHIEIKGIAFIGNSIVISNSAGRQLNTYGSALSISLDAAPGSNGTPRNLAHFLIADSSFENFNAAAWIRVINYNEAYSVNDLEIRDNRFVSRESNAVNPSEISYTSNAISVMGSLTSKTGVVSNVRITGNTINAAHLKGGIALWSGVRGATVVANTIADAGADAAIPNDKGAYAITVYDNAYYYDKDHPQGARHARSRPDDVHIERNVITRPKSCGIYVASANRVWIVGNKISGQSDPQNQTLPKGAIVLSYSLDGTVTGNNIFSSHIGMTLLGGEYFHIVDSNNSVSGIPTGGYRIFPSRGPPPAILTSWAANGL
jgi:hypothetical protein